MKRGNQNMNKDTLPELSKLIFDALDESLDGFLLCDAKKKGFPIIWSSDSFSKFTGFSKKYIMGQSCSFLQGPDTSDVTKQEIAIALSEGKPYKGKILNYKKDKTKFWNFLKLTPLYDGNGTLIYYLGIQTNISNLEENLEKIQKSEQTLRESERGYRLLVENSTDVIYKTDLNGNYTYVNKAFLKQTGYKESEILKMNCFQLIVKEYHQEAINIYKKQLEKGNSDVVSFEMPCIRKNNKLFWISQLSRLEYDDLGIPIGFSLTARDITEKHQTEEQLTQRSRELQEDYKTLIERMHEGVVRVGLDQTILFVNKRFCKMFGYKVSEFIGNKIIGLLVFDKESKDKIRDAMALRTKGKPSSYNVKAKTKEGKELWISINGSPLYSKNKVIGSMGIVMDITHEVIANEALTKSEFNLKTAQEIGHLGSYEWNLITNELLWNKQMYELYGIKKNIKPTLELSLSLIHPDDINSMQKAVEGTLNGDLKQTYGFRILRKDGNIRHAIARSRLFTDENGNPNKVIGTIQDITELKLAEVKIKELNESLERRVVQRTVELEKANKEIKSLLQEMHHRVKNNLQIVSSLMNLQANTAKDDEVAKVFEESRDRIQSMAFIHENLYMKQSVSEINLKEYIEPLLIARMRSVPGFHRRVLVEMDLLDISFNIDTVLPIGLLVNELVTNSIKHAFPNDKKGKICLSLKKEKVNSYILIYSDDGIGFKEKENNIDTNSLGLVLIESFVMQLDGKMKYNSNKNGTTYTIKFESN